MLWILHWLELPCKIYTKIDFALILLIIVQVFKSLSRERHLWTFSIEENKKFFFCFKKHFSKKINLQLIEWLLWSLYYWFGIQKMMNEELVCIYQKIFTTLKSIYKFLNTLKKAFSFRKEHTVDSKKSETLKKTYRTNGTCFWYL